MFRSHALVKYIRTIDLTDHLFVASVECFGCQYSSLTHKKSQLLKTSKQYENSVKTTDLKSPEENSHIFAIEGLAPSDRIQELRLVI